MEQPASGPRPKPNYACEACRSSKVRCLASPQPGICKRCADSKRECVFRTGPRTRRPKYPQPDAPPRPPPGPSKTFSIDFSMPADEDLGPDFDGIRAHHERMLEDLVPSPSEGGDNDDDDDDDSSQSVFASATTAPLLSSSAPATGGGGGGGGEAETFDFNDLSAATPSSSVTTTNSRSKTMTAAGGKQQQQRRPLGNLGIKPQFNLDSAERMLATFRTDMLPHYPVIAPPPEGAADVRSLARDAPFVLLAILAVSSYSCSPQGHGLYDEEFRKVLGLKFVTASERSLEMLQGLLIYCAWYPFHLRKAQAFKYQRMAVDIVRDLELDQENDDTYGPFWNPQDKLPEIRTFLACFYFITFYSWAWDRPPIMKYDSWVARCCDTLEQTSALDQDRKLVWLVRLQHAGAEIQELNRSVRKAYTNSGNSSSNNNSRAGAAPSEHHLKLMRLGLEAQLREWQNAIPERIAASPSIMLASLFTDVYLAGAPLIFLRRHLDSSSHRNNKKGPPLSLLSSFLNAATITTTRFSTSSDSNSNSNSYYSPSSSSSSPSSVLIGAVLVDPDKLLAAMQPLRALLDRVAGVLAAERAGLCGADWGRVVLAIIIAFRCSFPLPAAAVSRPGWDWARARRVLDLGGLLEKLAGDGSGNRSSSTSSSSSSSGSPGGGEEEEEEEDNRAKDKDQEGEEIGGGGGSGGDDARTRKIDVSVSAIMKVVLRSVKAKYDKKVAAFDAAAAAAAAAAATATAASTSHNNNAAMVDIEEQSQVGLELCPMYNGTISQYMGNWEIQQQQQQQQQQQGAAAGTFGFAAAGGDPSLPSYDAASQSTGPGDMADPSGAAAVGFPDAAKPAAYHDLWATMTVGWATDTPPGFDLMMGAEAQQQQFDEYPDL